MSIKDPINTRMKECYEIVTKSHLVRRMPVIIRIDGCHFHTFTRGFEKPFDEILMVCMQETTKYLCENIPTCVMGYTQSDEISLLLVDYKKISSQAWFDAEVNKMVSIAASMATLAFNRVFIEKTKASDESMIIYEKARKTGATFDCRAFNVPVDDINNYFLARQLDASRNSVQMVGHANFSQKQLNEKSTNMIQDMLHEEKSINWNDFPVPKKRGTCIIKEQYQKADTVRNHWIIDKNIPIFSQNTDYVNRLLLPEE